jgi:aminoglycoside phosphotransferase (APT) family kinase protein
MTTIFQITANALRTLSPAVPVALGQMLIADGSDFPDTFLVYTLVSESPNQHADNAETQRSHRVQVSTYSRSGLVSVPNVDGAMLAAGFQKSTTRELPYDSMTRHFGMATDYIYSLEA